MPSPALSRRDFLKRTSLASAAAVTFPYVSRAQGGASPNNKLNIAIVGCGGRGRAHVTAYAATENIVAFCDVDDTRAAASFKEHPSVPRFRDFRVMLEKLGKQIDAVSIATPDHMHFPIAMAAMALGKHVFVEKPVAHTVAEARALARTAREKKVATQMGNQGHAGEGTRLLKEWLDAGVLGEVGVLAIEGLDFDFVQSGVLPFRGERGGLRGGLRAGEAGDEGDGADDAEGEAGRETIGDSIEHGYSVESGLRGSRRGRCSGRAQMRRKP